MEKNSSNKLTIRQDPGKDYEIEEQIDGYNPEMVPPNFEFAKNHGKAKGIYNEANVKPPTKDKICPCCNLRFDLEPLPLSSDLKFLYQYGSGYSLYFLFLRCCVYLLMIIFLVSGIYSLVSNRYGEDCEKFEIAGTSFCYGNFIGMFALGNKRDEDNLIRVQLILNLIVVLMIMIFFHYIRYEVRKTTIHADDSTITPADYTLRVDGIPGTASDEEIIKWLQSFDKEKVKIVKINRTYNIRDYIKIIRQKVLKKKKFESEKDETKKEILKTEIKALNTKAKQEKNLLKKEKLTDVVFVTCETAQSAGFLKSLFKRSPLGKLIDITTGSRFSSLNFKGNRVVVDRAPEPTDILWQNLSFKLSQKLKSRTMTFFGTFLFISMGFGCIIFLNWIQYRVADDQGEEQSKSLLQALSVIASVLIFVINFGLNLTIRWLSGSEKHSTQTNFLTAVASKLSIAQFINTAFTTLFAKLIIFGASSSSSSLESSLKKINFYGLGGLIQNMFYVFILNAFLGPILLVVNPANLIKIMMRRRLEKQGKNCKKNQEAMNLMYEGVKVDMAQKFASLIKTMLLTCFYAPPMPFSLIFQIVGIILLFWAEKFCFLRLNQRPAAMGNELTFEMIEFLEWTAFLFASGNLAFNYVLQRSDTNERSYIDYGLAWATLGISLFHIISPMELLNEKVLPIKDDITENLTYYDAIAKFDTDYDVENPITKREKTKEFIELKSLGGIKNIGDIGRVNSKAAKELSQIPINKPEDIKLNISGNGQQLSLPITNNGNTQVQAQEDDKERLDAYTPNTRVKIQEFEKDLKKPVDLGFNSDSDSDSDLEVFAKSARADYKLKELPSKASANSEVKKDTIPPSLSKEVSQIPIAEAKNEDESNKSNANEASKLKQPGTTSRMDYSDAEIKSLENIEDYVHEFGLVYATNTKCLGDVKTRFPVQNEKDGNTDREQKYLSLHSNMPAGENPKYLPQSSTMDQLTQEKDKNLQTPKDGNQKNKLVLVVEKDNHEEQDDHSQHEDQEK